MASSAVCECSAEEQTADGYIFILRETSNRPIHTSRSDKQMVKMQKRVAKLISTDFACWIPICIMVYLRIGGVDISDLVYPVTAGVLLPINSAVNPMLYSPVLGKFFRRIFCNNKESTNTPETIPMKNLN